jgi:hypothetical protein
MANAGVTSTAAANLVRKTVVLVASLLFFLTVLAGCRLDASEGIRLGWFYRMVVGLSYGGEPLNIEVIIGCSSHAIGVATAAAIVEHGQYLWLRDGSPFPLTYELARMQ